MYICLSEVSDYLDVIYLQSTEVWVKINQLMHIYKLKSKRKDRVMEGKSYSRVLNLFVAVEQAYLSCL